MNICSYSPLKLPEVSEINKRFSILFKQVCYLSTPTSKGTFASNAAAITGGLVVGQIYNTSDGSVKVVI